jgi:hypothetical protein
MVFQFDHEIAQILEALDFKPQDLTTDQLSKLAMACFMLFDKGIGYERERTVKIIQQYAIQPMDLVRRIRKPLR